MTAALDPQPVSGAAAAHRPPGAAPLTVSVIVPVLNGGAHLRRCLRALKRLSPAPDEVIVVDDGSSDGSGQVAAGLGARVVRLEETGGPARARNAGARLAGGDLLVFIDADVEVHANTLAEILLAFGRDPSLAGLFGSYDDAPAAANFLSQYRNLLHHFVHQEGGEEASTFWSGCGAIRRPIFLSMRGFDERRRKPAMEDVELGYRMTAAGHRIRLCKQVLATHLKEWRAGSMLHADLMQRAVPWTELILRDRRFVNDLNLRRSGRACVVLACLAVCFLIAALRIPALLWAAVACLLALLALNARLLAFFGRKRGLLFALATVPWICLFQLYSGLGFALGLGRHLLIFAQDSRE